MKRLLTFIILGVLILVCTGCSAIQVAKRGITGGDIREDITTITQRDTYAQTAREFLDDEAMRGILKTPDNSNTQAYCKSFSGETGKNLQNKVFQAASFLENHAGFSGLVGKDKLVEKPKMNYVQRTNFCNNFLSFVGGLTPDERRKMLIFLGNDYFSGYWMAQKLVDDDYYDKMQVSKEAKTMIDDKGFDAEFHPNAALPESGLRGYLQQRFNWQTRNAGIAMLGWFKKADIDKELGLVNPASLDELQLKYGMFRDTGFTWVTSDRHSLKVRGGVRSLRTFTNGHNDKAAKKITDVWGATEFINADDLIENVHRFFEKFPPTKEVKILFYELGKKSPDWVLMRKVAVDSIYDSALQDVKNYARWLVEQKQVGASQEAGK
jgi:hypothetical protein